METGLDGLSRSIRAFKDGHVLHTEAWTDCAIAALEEAGLQTGHILLRPLSHQEYKADEEDLFIPIDVLCAQVSAHFNAVYLPRMMVKKWHIEPLRGKSAREREQMLKRVYKLNAEYKGMDVSRFWLIDDVLTTGTTIKAIISVLRQHYPTTPISIFTLARTDDDAARNENLFPSGKRYRWTPTGIWESI